MTDFDGSLLQLKFSTIAINFHTLTGLLGTFYAKYLFFLYYRIGEISRLLRNQSHEFPNYEQRHKLCECFRITSEVEVEK